MTRGTRIAVHAKTHEEEKRPARREGKHGARSPDQAIAIGLSKARRAGVKLKPPAKGKIALSGQALSPANFFLTTSHETCRREKRRWISTIIMRRVATVIKPGSFPGFELLLAETESCGQRRDCSRNPHRSRVGPAARTKYEFAVVNSPAPFLVWPHFERVQTGFHRKASEPSTIRSDRQSITGSP